MDTAMDTTLGNLPPVPGDAQTSYLINSTATSTYNGIPGPLRDEFSEIFISATKFTSLK
jgi:hypothetical protein